MKFRQTSTPTIAAAKASISRATAYRFEKDPKLLSHRQAPRERRWADPLAAIFDRASKDIRIYTSLDKPSSFVTEIQHLDKLSVEAVDGETTIPCPKCHQGIMQIRNGKHGAFRGCSAFPKCGHTQAA